MSCVERRELFLLYVMDGLEAAQAVELRAHLATGCPTCAAALAEAQATIDLLPHALYPQQPPPSAWANLLQRVSSSSQKLPPTRSSWRIFGPVLALAASIAILVTGIRFWMEARESTRMMTVEAHHSGQMMSASDMQMIAMADKTGQAKTHGQILYSAEQKRWQLSLADLPAPPAGRTYELWIITAAGDKIPAGTFDVDTAGHVTASAPMPEFTGKVAAVAVTDEPPGGVPAPTGSIRVLGAAKE